MCCKFAPYITACFRDRQLLGRRVRRATRPVLGSLLTAQACAGGTGCFCTFWGGFPVLWRPGIQPPTQNRSHQKVDLIAGWSHQGLVELRCAVKGWQGIQCGKKAGLPPTATLCLTLQHYELFPYSHAPMISTCAHLCIPRLQLPPPPTLLGALWGQQCLRMLAAWYIFVCRVEKPQATSACVASWWLVSVGTFQPRDPATSLSGGMPQLTVDKDLHPERYSLYLQVTR